MAYGLRIRFEHHDFLGNLSRFDISERDYEDNYIERILEGNEPCKPVWGDRSNTLPTIYGSELVLQFYAEVDSEFLFLFTADSKKFKVDHYSGDNLDLVWSGFIAPENWSEPLIAPPYPVSATAIDGLGNLKAETFPELVAERATLLELIATILQQTGLTLPINTCIDWQESAQAVGADPLAIHYKTTKTLADQNSYDLLEQLIPKCRIFQRLGQWWIISYTAMQVDEITYHKYNYLGAANGTATIGLKADGYWIENEPGLEILPAIKQQIVIQDYGYNDNLIDNGDFKTYNELLASFDTWDNINVTPQQRDWDKGGNKFVYIPGQQYPDTFANEGYGLITNGIKKTLKVKTTESLFSLALKYALMGSAYGALMFMKIRLIGSSNTYYLHRTRYYETTEPTWEWINYNDKLSQGDDHICLKSHSKESAYPGVTINHPYYNTFDEVKAWPWNEIQDHFEDLKISVAGIPVTGTLEFTLLVPYTNRAQIAGSCFGTVQVELLDEEAEKYPTQKSFKIINDLNNTYKPDTETFETGDYPDLPNAEIIYSGGLSRADESPTSAWTIPGSIATYTFVEMIGRMGVAQQAWPRQSYNIRLHQMVPSLAIIIPDILESGIRLLENGISYDNRMGAVEGTYIQLPDINIDIFDVEVATEFDDKTGQPTPGTTSTPSTATPINTEKSAVIVDENGTIVSAPSFFDSDYFESNYDEETGYNLIKTHNPVTIAPGSELRASINENQELTINQQHNPVTIAENSAAFGSINEDQVLTITPINIASGITYFLHEEIDTPTGYESALTIPAEDAQDADAITVNASEGEKLIDTYITAVGDPNTTVIPSGAWKFTTYTQVGTVIGVTEMVIRVYKRTITDIETELFNTSFVIDSTAVKQYDKLTVQQEINLALTDRLVFKYYAKTTSVPNRTVTLYYEGTDHYSHIDTPIKALAMHNPVTIASGSASRASINENQELTINSEIGSWFEDIAFEFCDVVAGTAKTYTLDISATCAYNILSAFLETDNGTLTGVAVKIGSTAVTSISSVTVDTAVNETTATGANAVAIGNRVYLAVAATYTGTPTLIRGKLKIQRT